MSNLLFKLWVSLSLKGWESTTQLVVGGRASKVAFKRARADFQPGLAGQPINNKIIKR